MNRTAHEAYNSAVLSKLKASQGHRQSRTLHMWQYSRMVQDRDVVTTPCLKKYTDFWS